MSGVDNIGDSPASARRSSFRAHGLESLIMELPVKPRSVFILTFLLVICVVSTSNQAFGQFQFEFIDDFCKSAAEQRDPYEERIETERHDFTQSAFTVGRRVLQLEAGYSLFYKDNHGEIETTHTTPELLLRAGLTEDIEFRLRWNHVWSFIDVAPDRIGSEDLRYSLKLQLTRECECGYLPTSALEIRGSAPTAGDMFSSGKAEFSLDYIYQWELCEGMTVAGSTGFGTNGFGDFGFVGATPGQDNFTAISQSAVLGLELSEQNVLYIEWYGVFSTGLQDEYGVSVFNMGIDHYLTDNLVVDLRAGVGMNDDSDDFFVGVGGGYRF